MVLKILIFIKLIKKINISISFTLFLNKKLKKSKDNEKIIL